MAMVIVITFVGEFTFRAFTLYVARQGNFQPVLEKGTRKAL